MKNNPKERKLQSITKNPNCEISCVLVKLNFEEIYNILLTFNSWYDIMSAGLTIKRLTL